MRPIPTKEALDWIIDKDRNVKKISVTTTILNKFFFSKWSKKSANGILIASENAVIFLLAVTPFKSPGTTYPYELIIFCASIITA